MSELLEPVHPTVVMSNAVHVYVSQAHKGELVMGAGVDSYNGYGQRGAFHIIERQMAAAVELFPVFARAHLLRTWGGIVDVTPDASPIVGRTPYENVYLNCGWGTGGFKATPGIGWCLADTVANDEPHPLHRPVRPRPLRHRRARRRARRRRRGPLSEETPMQLIDCPWCGPREEVEFHYGGQAHVAYPDGPAALTDEQWARYVFFRDNPKGAFAERWSHGAGCRRWFNAVRDTRTYQFLAVYKPGADPTGGDLVRVDGYGRVDRSRTLGFTFDGRSYTGHPGDTLASALLANGVHRIGSSVKLGRPRGISAAWAEDATGLVQVEEPFPEPMLLATTVELDDGLVARGLPGRAGWPRSPTPPATTACTTTSTCWSSGAGPAGLLAALTAARRGERVALVDDQPEPGGSLHRHRDASTGARRGSSWPTSSPSSPPTPRWCTCSAPPPSAATTTGSCSPWSAAPTTSAPTRRGTSSRQRVHRIRAGRVVVATGAHERPIVFADNDRPGIMLAASARDLLHRYGVLAGREVVVFTSDDAAYAAAVDLAGAGAAVHRRRRAPAGARTVGGRDRRARCPRC